MAVLNVPQALQLLQLQPGATVEQMRAAYKRLALQLHPDKQQQSTDATAAFAELSAAYSLLIQGCCVQQNQHFHQYDQVPESSFVPFETAYASGSLFSEELVNEAVLAGAALADVVNLQSLMSAAAEGQLAQHLAIDTPTAADEHLWRELYKRMQLRAQARQRTAHQHQQQQRQQVHESGVGVADLLADLLVRPQGPLFVEVTNDEVTYNTRAADEAQEGTQTSFNLPQETTPVRPSAQASSSQQQVIEPLPAQNASGTGDATQQQTVPLPSGRPVTIRQLVQHKQQQHSADLPQDVLSSSTQQQQQQQTPQQPAKQPKQQQHSNHQQIVRHQAHHHHQQRRHGWPFYWMWIRRALLAKAVMSLISSSFKAQRYDHRFPRPLPLPQAV